MTFDVQVSDQAARDLRDIFEYIAFDLLSVQNAANQLSRLEGRIASLEKMPKRFRAYDKEPWRSRGLRIMPVDAYLVLYITDEITGTVSILRVVYGGRDMDALLSRLSTS